MASVPWSNSQRGSEMQEVKQSVVSEAVYLMSLFMEPLTHVSRLVGAATLAWGAKRQGWKHIACGTPVTLQDSGTTWRKTTNYVTSYVLNWLNNSFYCSLRQNAHRRHPARHPFREQHSGWRRRGTWPRALTGLLLLQPRPAPPGGTHTACTCLPCVHTYPWVTRCLGGNNLDTCWNGMKKYSWIIDFDWLYLLSVHISEHYL